MPSFSQLIYYVFNNAFFVFCLQFFLSNLHDSENVKKAREANPDNW